LSPGTLIAASVKPFARAALESALEMLGEEDSPLRVRALSQLAKLPLHSPDLSRSKALARQALAAAERLDRPREIVIALHAQLIALSGPDDVDALLAAVARIQELEGDRRSFYLAEAQMGRYRAHLLRGEIGAADRALDEYAAIAGELGIPELMSVLARRPALKALHAGKFELARDGFARALARDTELGAGQISKQHVLEIASVAREREDLSWLDPGGGSAVREVLVETACLLANRAAVLAWRGRSEEARMLFEQLAAGDFAGVPRDSSYLNTLANLSEAAIALDERASARRLYVLLAPYASYNTPNALGIYRGSAAYFLAILADYLGDDSAADAHYAQALVANEALAYVPGVARTCFAYAGLLARRGPAQQPGRARELAQRALELGREIGMLELTRRSEQLLTA
jgi:hypothetical protein